MSTRNLVYKLDYATQVLTKLTNVNPIKENQQADIAWLYAPYGTNVALVKWFPNKFFDLTGVNPIPALKMFQETDEEVITTIIPEGDMETGWSLFYYPIGQGISGILKSNRASQYDVSFQELEVDNTDTDYVGFYSTTSTVEATVISELNAEFNNPLGTLDDGNYVNVYQTSLTTGSWKSWICTDASAGTWVKQSGVINEQLISNTQTYRETFKATSLANEDFSLGEDATEQALILNQFYSEIAELQAYVAALTGGTSAFMEIDDYDTDGVATKSVKYARNIGIDGNSVNYLTVLTKLGYIDQDVKTTSSPTFVAVKYDTNVQTKFDGTDLVDTYGDGITRERGKNLFTLIKARVAITNGDVLQYDGAVGASGVIWAKPADKTEINANPNLLLGVATTNVAINDTKDINLFGAINGLDTTNYDGNSGTSADEGQIIYYDSINGNGGITLTKPTAPNAQIPLGIISIYNVSNGQIKIKPELGLFLGDLHDMYFNGHVFTGNEIIKYDISNLRWTWVNGEEVYMSRDIQNGAIKETFDVKYNATSSVMELTNPAGNSLTAQFSSGDYEIDVTTAVPITITFGTTTVPVKNYIYILETAPTTIVVDTGSFPSAEHIKLAEVTVLDEAYTDTEGPLGNQNHNNHEKGTLDIGALNHIRDRIRSLGAQWESGVSGATSGEWVNNVAGTLYWTSTSGTVWQMHLQTYMAKDTSGTDDMHIVNDFTTPYNEITSFNEITTYSDGTSIGNDYFNVFVYGIINKAGEYTPIMVNTPSAGYNNLPDAQADLDSTLVTTVPTEFRRIAFPIARLLLRKVGTTYSFIQSYDLREQRFGIGGTTGTGVLDGEFIDTTFELQYVGDTSAVAKVSAENVPTGTTVTVKWPNTNIDLQDLLGKVDLVLYNDTSYVVLTSGSAAGTEYLYVDQAGTKRKMTLDEVAAYANTATGAFVPSGDYSGNGLIANMSTFLKHHTGLLDSGADVYIDVKAPTTGQIMKITMPTMTSTNNIRISTNNKVTYAELLVGTQNINGDVLSDKTIEVMYNGTNWLYMEQEIIDNQSLPYTGAVGQYTEPKNGVTATINEDTAREVDNLYGQKIAQKLDGNFETTLPSNFSPFGSSSDVISTDQAVFGSKSVKQTGDGLQSTIRGALTTSVINGNYYLFRGYIYVGANATAISTGAKKGASGGSAWSTNTIENNFDTLASGKWLKFSRLLQSNETISDALIEVISTYADAASQSGEIHYLDGLDAFDVTDLYNDGNITVASIEQYLDGTYMEQGIHTVGASQTYTPSEWPQSMQDYFTSQGIVSGDTIEGSWIESVGKNKFDKLSSSIITGFALTASTGALVSNPNVEISAYIPVIGSASYTVHEGLGSGSLGHCFYDSNQTFISGVVSNPDNQTITAPSNAKYVRISTIIADREIQQLELGTTATDYEAHKTAVQHINGELLSDRDNLDYETDKRDFNDVVQSASFNQSSSQTNTISFYMTASNLPNLKQFSTNTKIKIGDTIFRTLSSSEGVNDVDNERAGLHPSLDRYYIGVNKTRLSTVDIAGFEAYLQANDVEFIYELANAIPRTPENGNVIDVQGQLLIGAKNTYTHYSNGVIGTFYATSAINTKAQVQANVDAIIEVKKETQALDGRMDKAESEIDTLQTDVGDVSTLDTTSKEVTGSINELHGEVNTNTSNISTNTSDIASNAGNISTNTTNIATNTGDISAHDTRLDNIETKTDFVSVSASINLDKVSEITVLKGTTTAVSNATTKPASNITLAQSQDNFDALIIEFGFSGGTVANYYLQFNLTTNADEMAVDKTYNISTTGENRLAFRIQRDSTTALTAYHGVIITTTYGATASITSAASANLEVNAVYGIKY